MGLQWYIDRMPPTSRDEITLEKTPQYFTDDFAPRRIHVAVPVVVRLEGTNVEQGKTMLRNSTVAITTAEGLTDAAQKVVKLAGGQG